MLRATDPEVLAITTHFCSSSHSTSLRNLPILLPDQMARLSGEVSLQAANRLELRVSFSNFPGDIGLCPWVCSQPSNCVLRRGQQVRGKTRQPVDRSVGQTIRSNSRRQPKAAHRCESQAAQEQLVQIYNGDNDL